MSEEPSEIFLRTAQAVREALQEELDCLESCDFRAANALMSRHTQVYDEYNGAARAVLEYRRESPLPPENEEEIDTIMREVTVLMERCRHAIDHAIGLQQGLCAIIYGGTDGAVRGCPYDARGNNTAGAVTVIKEQG